MTLTTERPLISFGIAAFNQERFIEEAVRAAFSQTYSPLEIILSDDCSSDCTYDVMQKLASSYLGPHKVLLNRNPKNRGLGGHVSRIVELSKGELIVIAAGDDVSLPHRTEAIWRAWEDSARRAMVIASGFIVIDEEGRLCEGNRKTATSDRAAVEVGSRSDLYEYCATLDVRPASRARMTGATFAWNPRLFSQFGPMPDRVVHDDSLIMLRGLFAGTCVRIWEPLVKRRLHTNNLFFSGHEVAADLKNIDKQEGGFWQTARSRAGLYEAFVSDIKTALNEHLVSPDEARKLTQVCETKGQIQRLLAEYGAATTRQKMSLIRRLMALGVPRDTVRYLLIRLVPYRVFRNAKRAVNSIRRSLAWGHTK